MFEFRQSLFCAISLLFAGCANAQTGFALPDITVMLPAATLSQRNECRKSFPELASDLDAGLELMIQHNLDSFSREQWVQLSGLDFPLPKSQSRDECIQLSTALASWDWKPLIVDVRKEVTCFQDFSRATELRDRRNVIGIVFDDTSESARIAKIEPNGPADKSGMRVGDIIVEFGNIRTPSKCQLALAVVESPLGKQTTALVIRDAVQLHFQLIPHIMPTNLSDDD